MVRGAEYDAHSGSPPVMMMLGTHICIACPLIVGWNSSRPDHLPPLDIQDPHGRAGVGTYLDVFRGWVLISLGATSFAVVVWMLLASRTADFPMYAVQPFPSSLLLAALYYRCATRAMDVRREYRNALAKSGATWTEVAAANPPEDPTADFIGANVWLVGPATVTLLGLVWAVVKELGLDTKLLP